MTVYLLHFDRPYKHARHYTGVATQVVRRLRHHQTGSGARLMQVVTEAGIGFTIARKWRGGRALERAIKRNQYGSKTLLCPLCCGKRHTLRVLRRWRVQAQRARRAARKAVAA